MRSRRAAYTPTKNQNAAAQRCCPEPDPERCRGRHPIPHQPILDFIHKRALLPAKTCYLQDLGAGCAMTLAGHPERGPRAGGAGGQTGDRPTRPVTHHLPGPLAPHPPQGLDSRDLDAGSACVGSGGAGTLPCASSP